MRRGVVWALMLLLVAAAACQPDEPRRERSGGGDLPQSSRTGEAEEEGGPRPVRYQLFNRVDLSEPPRTTLHLLVDAQATRGELRVTLAQAIDEAVAADSTLVALRAVGYVGTPSTRGPRQANLVPVAWAEWLPPSGWYESTPQDRDAIHRHYFYQGNPPEWQN